MIPAEFIGRARQLCRQMRAEDDKLVDALLLMTRQVTARLRRKPTIRPEMAIELERSWRCTMPAIYRVGGIIVDHPKKGLRLSELRLSTMHGRRAGWGPDDYEDGIAVTLVELLVEKGKPDVRLWPAVNVGLHALARRYQRGRDKSDEAVLADLFALTETVDNGLDLVVVPGGVWVGGIARVGIPTVEGTGALNARMVRTFLDHDAGASSASLVSVAKLAAVE